MLKRYKVTRTFYYKSLIRQREQELWMKPTDARDFVVAGNLKEVKPWEEGSAAVTKLDKPGAKEFLTDEQRKALLDTVKNSKTAEEELEAREERLKAVRNKYKGRTANHKGRTANHDSGRL